MKDKLREARAAITKARNFLDRGRIEEAEEAASRAVGAFVGGEAHALLIEALTLLGISRARSLQAERASECFRRALSLADHEGDNESAGRVAISYMEELSGQMKTDEVCDVYLYAERMLTCSRHRNTLVRLRRCALIVIASVRKKAGA